MSKELTLVFKAAPNHLAHVLRVFLCTCVSPHNENHIHSGKGKRAKGRTFAFVAFAFCLLRSGTLSLLCTSAYIYIVLFNLHSSKEAKVANTRVLFLSSQSVGECHC